MQIHYKTSARAKHLRITVKGSCEVIVTVPKGINRAQAESFVEKHQTWISEKLAAAKEKQSEKPKEYEIGSEFKTKLTTVRVLETAQDKPFLKQDKEGLGIHIPKGTDISQEAWQNLIKTQIEEQLRREAKHFLIKKTYEIAAEKGIKVGKVSIRITKSRWGSCSHRDDISLSAYCMTLPDELIDYVICHELAHVKEKNHSSKFWEHLETLLPGAGKLDKEMKKYSTAIL